MTDSEEKDGGGLPTAANVVYSDNGIKFPRPAIEYYSELEEGDELVRRSDAVEKMGQLANQSVEEGREDERLRIKALIQDIFEDSFRPCLEGSAEELRSGGSKYEVAGMLEHYAEKFEEELLEELEQ